jgi:hypothetical protein
MKNAHRRHIFIVNLGKTFTTEFVGIGRQSATNFCSDQNSHKKTNDQPLLSSKRRPLFKTVKVKPRMIVLAKTSRKLHCIAGEGQQQFTALLRSYRKLFPDVVSSIQSQTSYDNLMYPSVHVRSSDDAQHV